MTLFRSAIYIPGDHQRAMQKAASLDADTLIFDLEDGVAPEQKPAAREHIAHWLRHRPTTHHHVAVRMNHRRTAHYQTDITTLRSLPIDSIMLSKVGGVEDVEHFIATANMAPTIWCNIETPQGITRINEIAAHPQVTALIAGTNDLANDLRIQRNPDRQGLMHCLQAIQLAARAHQCLALDGTFIHLDDMAGLQSEAEQGRMLGFDGKTLIHPKQIEAANQAFSPSACEMDEAHSIVSTYEQAMREQKAVTLLNGRMIERLHYDRALEMIGIETQIAQRHTKA